MAAPRITLQAAHAALIDPDNKVLLVKGFYRPHGTRERIASSRWMLPGGRKEDSDSTLVHTCYRELNQELGCGSTMNCELVPIDSFVWGRPRRCETIYLGRLLRRPTLRLQDSEIHTAGWFSEEQISHEIFINDKFKEAVQKAFYMHSALNIVANF